MDNAVQTFNRLTRHFSKAHAALPVFLGVLLSSVGSLAQVAGNSGCLPEEGVFFSCQLKGNDQVVSICTAPKAPPFASVTYRYAAGTNHELTYTASGKNQKRFLGTVSAISPKVTVRQIWFELKGSKYVVTSCIGGDCAHRGGLIVFRKGRLEISQPCAEGSGGHPWFSSDVVRFGSSLDSSHSNTGLIHLQDFDNNVEVLYPSRGVIN